MTDFIFIVYSIKKIFYIVKNYNKTSYFYPVIEKACIKNRS